MLGILGIGAGLLGGLFQASAANRAADAQQQAAEQQIALQRQVYNQTRGDLRPFYKSGTNALNALNFEMGLGDRPRGYSGFQNSPGYEFAREEGMRGIMGSAAASGMLGSGATLKALSRYGTGMAQQDYGNWMNRLQGMTGGGLSAATLGANAGQAYATGAGNALGSIGNAQAAGSVGVGNAINSGIGNALGAYQYQQLLNNYQVQ
jgi:hypothetical protein